MTWLHRQGIYNMQSIYNIHVITMRIAVGANVLTSHRDEFLTEWHLNSDLPYYAD